MKIEVKDVCKSFRKKQVLDNVNYTLYLVIFMDLVV